MEVAGFGNPLLYFNTCENWYTHVINSYVYHVLFETPILVFHESIGTISVYSANAEWNSFYRTVYGTERNNCFRCEWSISMTLKEQIYENK